MEPSSRTARSLQKGLAVGMVRASLTAPVLRSKVYAGLADQQAAGLLIGEYAEQGTLGGARVDPLGRVVFSGRDAPDGAGAVAADDDGSVGGGSDALGEEILTGDSDDGRVGGVERAGGGEEISGGGPFDPSLGKVLGRGSAELHDLYDD